MPKQPPGFKYRDENGVPLAWKHVPLDEYENLCDEVERLRLEVLWWMTRANAYESLADRLTAESNGPRVGAAADAAVELMADDRLDFLKAQARRAAEFQANIDRELGAWIHMPKADHDQLLAEIDRLRAYRVAVDAIRTALLEVASDEAIDPRYTLAVIGRILHNLDNVLASQR